MNGSVELTIVWVLLESAATLASVDGVAPFRAPSPMAAPWLIVTAMGVAPPVSVVKRAWEGEPAASAELVSVVASPAAVVVSAVAASEGAGVASGSPASVAAPVPPASGVPPASAAVPVASEGPASEVVLLAPVSTGFAAVVDPHARAVADSVADRSSGKVERGMGDLRLVSRCL